MPLVKVLFEFCLFLYDGRCLTHNFRNVQPDSLNTCAFCWIVGKATEIIDVAILNVRRGNEGVVIHLSVFNDGAFGGNVKCCKGTGYGLIVSG